MAQLLVAVRWCAAGVALGSAAVHVLPLATGGTPSPGLVVALLVMAMACLPCAVHLVLLPRRRTWVQTAVVSAAMLGGHPLLPVGSGAGHHGAVHAGAVGIAMVLVPLLGLVLALSGLALEVRRPGRAGQSRSGPPVSTLVTAGEGRSSTGRPASSAASTWSSSNSRPGSDSAVTERASMRSIRAGSRP